MIGATRVGEGTIARVVALEAAVPLLVAAGVFRLRPVGAELFLRAQPSASFRRPGGPQAAVVLAGVARPLRPDSPQVPDHLTETGFDRDQ